MKPHGPHDQRGTTLWGTDHPRDEHLHRAPSPVARSAAAHGGPQSSLVRTHRSDRGTGRGAVALPVVSALFAIPIAAA